MLLNPDRQAVNVSRVRREGFDTRLGDQDGVAVPKPAEARNVEPGFDAQDHAGLEHRRVADVQKRAFVDALPQTVPDVMSPKPGQPLAVVIGPDSLIDPRAGLARAQVFERQILQVQHMPEIEALVGARFAQKHRALEFAQVAVHARPGPGDERVADRERGVDGDTLFIAAVASRVARLSTSVSVRPGAV